MILSRPSGSPARPASVSQVRRAPSSEPVDTPASSAARETASHALTPSTETWDQPSTLANSALADALNRAQFGVVVVAPLAPPVFVNDYARRVLESGDGLLVTERGLEALRADDTRLLREMIARSASRQVTTSATLQLPRKSSRRPLILHLPAQAWTTASSNCATIFVCDPHHEPQVDPAMLCRLFGFTRAEAALAVLLMRGVTIEQAAARLFISQHTVRTHVKRMLLKTDTGRQSELLRLLLTCAAQVRLD